MTVTVKGSDWFPVSMVGNIILYIMKHKQESMLIETEDFFHEETFVGGNVEIVS